MSTMLATLIRYQAWANAEFFDHLAAVDRTRHDAAFLRAMRLMNHAHVVAEIFAAHLAGRAHGYTATNTDDTPRLADLRAAVAASDAWYRNYVRGVSPAALSEAVAFGFTDGDRGCMTREEMITHVVLHGGYHRGEVGRILMQIGAEAPWDTFAVWLHRDQPERRGPASASPAAPGLGAAPQPAV